MDLLVTIPHGIQLGSWVQQARVRELNGYDEQLIAEMSNYPLPFRVTALLSRVVAFNSDLDSIEIVRNLTVGDRVALVLHIRRIMLGDKLQCVLSCPECKNKMSLDLSISTLLQPPITEPSTEYIINVKNSTLKIRPVRGRDLESLFIDNTANKAEQLLRSCIISSELPLQDLDLTMLSSILEELDPQAETILNLICPNCNHAFHAPLNIEDFILQELNARERQLEYDIHQLAFYYHWSEDSILSLPLRKRKRYVELVNKTLSGERI